MVNLLKTYGKFMASGANLMVNLWETYGKESYSTKMPLSSRFLGLEI